MEILQANIVILVANNEHAKNADKYARVAMDVDSHLHEFLVAVEQGTFIERAGKTGSEEGTFWFRMG